MFMTIHHAYRIFNVEDKKDAKLKGNLGSPLSFSEHALAEMPVDLVSDIFPASDSHIRMFNDCGENLSKKE